MERLDNARLEFREIDALSGLSSPVHGLSPLAKLIVTILYIFTVISFNKYDLSGLFVLILYPVVMYSLAGISLFTGLFRLRFILPLLVFIGIFNPLLDRKTAFYAGGLAISYGMISMVSLMLKGVLSLMASFILIATTKIDGICLALRQLKVPSVIVSLVLLTYRYIFVLMDELSIMVTAYKLRAPGQKGIYHGAWGSFLGQLLLRSMDRAGELYFAMELRAFNGEFTYVARRRAGAGDVIFVVLSIGFFVLARRYNLAVFLSGRISGFF